MSFSHNHLAGLFELGLTKVVSKLRPERAFVAYRGRESSSADYPTPFATHGFAMAGLFVDEDISTEVIRKTLREGRSQLIVDSTPGLTNRTSVILSGLRSVLTVPLKYSNGLTIGMFYLDNRVKAGAFKTEHEQRLSELADSLVSQVAPIENRMRESAKDEVHLQRPLAEVRQEALSLSDKGHYTQGLGLIEQWLCGREESVDLGLAYGVRGRILQQMGQLDGALESVAIAVYLLGNRASAGNHHYPMMLNNLAGIHVVLENLHRAQGLFEAAENCWNRLLRQDDKHHAGLAGTLYNLGRLRAVQDDSEGARGWYEKALASSRQAFGPDHPRTLKIQENLDSL